MRQARALRGFQVLMIMFGWTHGPLRANRGWAPTYRGPIFKKIGKHGALITNVGATDNWPLGRYAMPPRVQTNVPRALASWEIPDHPKAASAARLSALKSAFAAR